jgi:hypothetical protein
MSKQQSAAEIATEQMFIDTAFWEDVERHLLERNEETIDNATVKRNDDQSSGLAGARISAAE